VIAVRNKLSKSQVLAEVQVEEGVEPQEEEVVAGVGRAKT
jgi:hypothetical protein